MRFALRNVNMMAGKVANSSCHKMGKIRWRTASDVNLVVLEIPGATMRSIVWRIPGQPTFF
jgi:hypothetical protein